MRRICIVLALAAYSLYGGTKDGTKGPIVPGACADVPALLSSADGRSLDARDETALDTARIQGALDHCPTGKSVRLSAQGRRRAFVSGPLHLRTGVMLVLDEQVVLFASRDAREFQVKQGSCGVVDDKGEGCKALISCNAAAGAGVTGGVIDGRGGSTILGETFSWRDLRQEANLKNGKVNAPGLLHLNGCNDFTFSNVILRDPAGRSVLVRDGTGFTASGVRVRGGSKERDGNTAVQIEHARNVNITNSDLQERPAARSQK